MTRPAGIGPGFHIEADEPAARWTRAVVTSLAIGSLSLGLIVALTALSIRVAVALPLIN